MSWLFGSSNNAASAPVAEAQPAENTTSKPKPCCVCTKEKSARDECMLFSKADDPAQGDCKSLVEQYRTCMAGYGFKV